MDAAMTYLPALGALALLHLLMAAIPGPNTIVVGRLAASRSRRAGLEATLGVLTGTMAWVILSLAGVGMLLSEASAIYGTLRLVGSAYLLYVGVRLLLSAAQGGAAPRQAPASGGTAAYRAGLLTTLSNPKSAIFWSSVFVVAVPPEAPLAFYAAIVTIVAVQTTAWYGLVAFAFATGPSRRAYGRLGRWLEAAGGSAMVFFGLSLALSGDARAR